MKTAFPSCIEPLEARIAPAGVVTASLVNGKLTLIGDDADNSVSVLRTAIGEITITGLAATDIVLNGAPAAAAVVTALPVADIIADLRGGSDTFAIGGLSLAKGVKFTGGAGNDFLGVTDSQMEGALIFLGGDGNDQLTLSGARFHAGKVFADLGGGDNTFTSTVGSLSVKGDLKIKGGSDGETISFASSEVRVGGNFSLLPGAGLLMLNISSSLAVDGSLVITQGTGVAPSGILLNSPNFTVAGNLQVTTAGPFSNSFSLISSANVVVTGKTVLKGGSSDDTITFSTVRASFIGGLTASLGEGINVLTLGATTALELGSVKVTGGSGPDVLTFNAGPEVVIAGVLDAKLGHGVNSVFVPAIPLFAVGGGVKIAGGSGPDTVSLSPGLLSVKKGISVSVGDGVNMVSFNPSRAHVSGLFSVAMGVPDGVANNFNASIGEGLFDGGISVKSKSGGLFSTFTAATLTVVGDFKIAAAGVGNKIVGLTAGNVAISGALDFKGGSGFNTFTVVATNYHFGKSKVKGGAAADNFTFTGSGQVVGLVDINLGAGGNVANINASAGAVFHKGLKFVSTSAAADTDNFNLTGVVLPGNLTAKLGAGNSSVTLNDIVASGKVTVDTGAGNDTVDFENVSSGINSLYLGLVKIILGAGTDTVNLGLFGGALGGVKIQAPFTIDGGADTDTVNQNNVTPSGAGVINLVNIP